MNLLVIVENNCKIFLYSESSLILRSNKQSKNCLYVQYKLPEVESRTQSSRLRTKKSDAKAKHSPLEDRPSRGQIQKCSRPKPRTKDTSASRHCFRRSPKKKKKKGLRKFFARFLAFSCIILKTQKSLLL